MPRARGDGRRGQRPDHGGCVKDLISPDTCGKLLKGSQVEDEVMVVDRIIFVVWKDDPGFMMGSMLKEKETNRLGSPVRSWWDSPRDRWQYLV